MLATPMPATPMPATPILAPAMPAISLQTVGRLLRRLLVLALLAAAAPAWAAPQGTQAGPQDSVFNRDYRVQHLNVHEAEVLVWDECATLGKERCFVRQTAVQDGTPLLLVAATAEGHERIARALAQRDVVPKTQAFQVILLVADQGAATGAETLPAAAAKAVDDIRGLLSFTRYRLVDQALVRSAERADLVLSGADGLPLAVALVFDQRVGDQVFIRALRVAAPAVIPGPENPQGPRRTTGRQLLETSFGMQVGETVVVGTSRLDGGGEALVVLLTAVP